jgi:hypothetical protein
MVYWSNCRAGTTPVSLLLSKYLQHTMVAVLVLLCDAAGLWQDMHISTQHNLRPLLLLQDSELLHVQQ